MTMDKNKNEPQTAATAESSIAEGKLYKNISSENDYTTKKSVCQEDFDKLYDGTYEISAIADDITLLLKDTLQHFDFMAKYYIANPEEGSVWFHNNYDILAAKVRFIYHGMNDICNKFEKVL